MQCCYTVRLRLSLALGNGEYDGRISIKVVALEAHLVVQVKQLDRVKD